MRRPERPPPLSRRAVLSVCRGHVSRLPQCFASMPFIIFTTKSIPGGGDARVAAGLMMTVGLDPHAGVDQWYIYEYFDNVLEIDRRRYPASSQIREWMRAAGFARLCHARGPALAGPVRRTGGIGGGTPR